MPDGTASVRGLKYSAWLVFSFIGLLICKACWKCVTMTRWRWRCVTASPVSVVCWGSSHVCFVVHLLGSAVPPPFSLSLFSINVFNNGSFNVLSTSILLLSNPSVTKAGLLQYHFFAFCLHKMNHKLHLIPLCWNAHRRALLNYVVLN